MVSKVSLKCLIRALSQHPARADAKDPRNLPIPSGEMPSEMMVICGGRRTGLIDRAFRRIVIEVDEEALLHVNGSDAHDGRKEEQQVGDQLHDCDVGNMLDSGGGLVQ